MNKTFFSEVNPYITRDGSEIRELMHPEHHPVTNQSLAHATIPSGSKTLLHRHLQSEELYYVLSGEGLMRLGDREFQIESGDTVLIPPGTNHCVSNTGPNQLTLLCCCSPPYRHEDTILTD